MSDYVIGYGKVPTDSQYKKGQSGNLLGRPKKLPFEAMSFLEDQLLKSVTINVAGKAKKLMVIELILLKVMHIAAQGNLKAVKWLCKYTPVFDKLQVNEGFSHHPKTQKFLNEVYDEACARIAKGGHDGTS